MTIPATVIGRLWPSLATRWLCVRDLSVYRGLFVCLGSCFSLLAMAQAPHLGTPSPQPTIKVSTVVVNVYAIVEDRKGHLASDLNKEDFLVTEDNVPQQTEYFSRETDAPLTLGIVIDTSASQGSVLAIEQQEAKRLLREVLRPQDSAFVVHFDQQVELLQGLTGDQQLLARAIDGTAINERPPVIPTALTHTGPGAGGSHFYDAVCQASKLMSDQVGRRVLVLLTDGEDLGSAAKPTAALEAAERAEVILYSVAVIDPEFYSDRGMGFHGNSALKKLSAATGGKMSRVSDANSTTAAFGQIGKELRGQYLLGYTPSKQGDGSFRKINVQVRSGNWRVRARRGYYSRPE